MKEILSKLNETILICETKLRKVNVDNASNAAKSNALDKKEKKVEEANKLAVEGIERLNSLKAKHEDLEVAKKLKVELKSEIKRYKNMTEALKQEFIQAEKLREDGLAEIKEKKLKLWKEIEKLNVSKANYKTETMKTIELELDKKGIKL